MNVTAVQCRTCRLCQFHYCQIVFTITEATDTDYGSSCLAGATNMGWLIIKRYKYKVQYKSGSKIGQILHYNRTDYRVIMRGIKSAD